MHDGRDEGLIMAGTATRTLWRLGALALCAGLVTPAFAQAPAAPAKIVVPLGATGMVENPCPPQPASPIARVAEPGRPAAYATENLAAYQAYGVWRAANDWADLCHYREANRAVAAGPRPRVVFMGDSITELWRLYDPGFFSDGVVDRGISGQTTPQMVVRFYADVVALKPRAVHIMAGTNDIAANTGPTSEDQFKANIMAMTELAQANGIRVILASIPPTKTFSWRPELKPANEVRTLNAWLRGYAATRHATYVDYYAVLTDAEGGIPPQFSADGVHPLRAGYAVMKAETLKALAKAERR
jgi:lysophospholipase L1-like esterase